MKAIRRLWIIFSLALLTFFTAGISPIHAAPASQTTTATPSERILNYDISAIIDKDAKMTVTERITVNINHQRIRRGITRTYPVKMRVGENDLHKFGFKVISTKFDGREIANKTETRGVMTGMAIGNANSLAPKGEHTYEIVYETTGHVRSLEKHDEIYYNAVGLDVVFPIDKASFRLTLPDGTKPLLTKAYTGAAGERGEDYKMTGDMAFETTRMLKPHEAFTVVVGWQKGVVAIPNDQAWASTHRTIALIICVAVVLIVLALCWLQHFRKRFKGVVYPIFTPPEDMSPGMAAYLNHFDASPIMLQADLIWSAIKGFCRIDMTNKRGTAFNWINVNDRLSKRCYFCAEAIPTDAEECPECGRQQPASTSGKKTNARLAKNATTLAGKIANVMFSVVDTIILGYENSKSQKAHSSLTSAWRRLHDFYRPQVKNLTTLIFAHALTALILGQIVLMYFLGDIWYAGLAFKNPMSVFQMLYLPALPALFAVAMIAGTVYAWKMYLGRTIVRYSVCTVFFIGFLLAGAVLWILVGDLILTGTYLLLWGAPILFWLKWNEIPNKATQEKLQIIEGLKMYINTAEKHRLEAINAPDDTAAQYEAILPYAIALGCADAWEKRYAPILAELNYLPSWIEEDPAATEGFETWDERRMRRYEEEKRREMFSALVMPSVASKAVENAIAQSQATRLRASRGGSGGWSSSGGSSGSSRSGSSGGGSGGGGVGGW